MKKSIKVGIGLLTSGLLIAWMAYSLNWREVAAQLGNLNYIALVPCTALFILQYYFRAYRWRYLLPDGEKMPVTPLLDAIMVGNLATYILSLRAGEFIRPYMLTLRSGYSFPTAFVSVVIERFFDLSAMLFSFWLVTLNVEGIADWAQKGAFVLGGLAFGILLFIVGGIFFAEQIEKLSGLLLSHLPDRHRSGIQRFLNDFLQGAKVLQNSRNLLVVTVLTVIVWILCYLLFYAFLFMSPDFQPSVWLAVTVGVVVALAVAAPSAPGFIGVFQVACIASFEIFSISKESATAYALVLHLYQYILVTLFGALGLIRNGLTMKELSSGRGSQKVQL